MSSGADWQYTIHSSLDDAGLAAKPFRVLCHVLRRGNCTESVENMAKHVGFSAKCVREALRELIAERGMIERQTRKGRTSIYRGLPPERWKTNPSPKSQGVPKTVRGGVSKIDRGDSPKTTGDPSPKPTDEGNPIKEIKKEGGEEGSPPPAMLSFDGYEAADVFPSKWPEILQALSSIENPDEHTRRRIAVARLCHSRRDSYNPTPEEIDGELARMITGAGNFGTVGSKSSGRNTGTANEGTRYGRTDRGAEILDRLTEAELRALESLPEPEQWEEFMSEVYKQQRKWETVSEYLRPQLTAECNAWVQDRTF